VSTQGTGRFNIAAGSLATMVGIGAGLSNTIGGVLIQHFNYRASFLGLAAIAALATAVLSLTVPETLAAHPPATPPKAKALPSEPDLA
jgi:MFS family permease